MVGVLRRLKRSLHSAEMRHWNLRDYGLCAFPGFPKDRIQSQTNRLALCEFEPGELQSAAGMGYMQEPGEQRTQ